MQPQIQPQIWTGVNWVLIVAIIAGSAVLAYVGDVLGFKYGKQRISIFGLRPRYTSRLITAFTGMLISGVVLAVLSLFSDNVRTALFTMKYLQQDLNRTAFQLQKSQNELQENQSELQNSLVLLAEQQSLWQTAAVSLDIARFDLQTLQNDRDVLLGEKDDLEASVSSLREDIAEMKLELDRMRLGAIAIQANSLLAQRVIAPGTPEAEVRAILAAFREEIRAGLAAKRSEGGTEVSSVRLVFDPAEEDRAVEHAADSSERMYVRALAAENFAEEEEIKVRLIYGTSYLLYNQGETLYRELIDPKQDFDAEEALHVFLRGLKKQMLRNGVLPDPATNSVGSLEGEAFFEAVERLKSIAEPTIINAVALQDIYTEGPVRIKITLE